MAPSKTNIPSDESMLDLEQRLAGILKPIQPSREVVQRLRERIRIPDRKEIVLRLQDWRRMFLVFGGVMSAMVIAITLGRAFFYFMSKRHM